MTVSLTTLKANDFYLNEPGNELQRLEQCPGLVVSDDPFESLNTRLAEHDAHQHRIYLDEKGEFYATVDEIDYQWAIQWRWTWKISRGGGHNGGGAIKFYARRAVGINAGGHRIKTFTAYLHIEIMKRATPDRPCPKHSIVDHLDGDSLNCSRSNLRWATWQMNNVNVHGAAAQQLGLQI